MRRRGHRAFAAVVSAVVSLGDLASARAQVGGASPVLVEGQAGPVLAHDTDEEEATPPVGASEPAQVESSATDAPVAETPTSTAPPAPARFDPWAASREARRRGEPTSAAAPLGSPSSVPGGYWGLGEAPIPAPPDGDDEVLAGTVLVPIGLLTAASAVPFLYLFEEAHCEERAPRLGYQLDARQCRGLFIGNAVRTVYGTAMLVSGIVLLGVGLHRRKRHREWKHHHVRVDFAPSGEIGGGVTFRF